MPPRTEHAGWFVGGVGGRRPWVVLAFGGFLTNKMLWEGTKKAQRSKGFYRGAAGLGRK